MNRMTVLKLRQAMKMKVTQMITIVLAPRPIVKITDQTRVMALMKAMRLRILMKLCHQRILMRR